MHRVMERVGLMWTVGERVPCSQHSSDHPAGRQHSTLLTVAW